MRLLSALLPVRYVRFDADEIVVADARSGRELRDAPFVAVRSTPKGLLVHAIGAPARRVREPDVEVFNPFDHPRLVLHQFEIAEALLRYAFQMLAEHWVLVRPFVVVHPQRELAPGLSDLEERALRELALAAGGREAAIHVGHRLDLEEVVRIAAGERKRTRP